MYLKLRFKIIVYTNNDMNMQCIFIHTIMCIFTQRYYWVGMGLYAILYMHTGRAQSVINKINMHFVFINSSRPESFRIADVALCNKLYRTKLAYTHTQDNSLHFPENVKCYTPRTPFPSYSHSHINISGCHIPIAEH